MSCIVLLLCWKGLKSDKEIRETKYEALETVNEIAHTLQYVWLYFAILIFKQSKYRYFIVAFCMKSYLNTFLSLCWLKNYVAAPACPKMASKISMPKRNLFFLHSTFNAAITKRNGSINKKFKWRDVLLGKKYHFDFSPSHEWRLFPRFDTKARSHCNNRLPKTKLIVITSISETPIREILEAIKFLALKRLYNNYSFCK